MDIQSVQWLHASTRELLEVPDVEWAKFAIGSLPADPSELTQMVDTAYRVASEHWTWLHDWQPGEKPLVPLQEIERHSVRVVEEAPGPLDSHYVHFAAFDPTAKMIHVSIASVRSVTECLEMAELPSILGPISLLDVVLWHEYFHVWSYVMRKRADRRSKRTWRFGRRKSEAALERVMEELVAVEFSRQAAGIQFHPQLLQWLLIYTKDPRRAQELARNVLGKSW